VHDLQPLQKTVQVECREEWIMGIPKDVQMRLARLADHTPANSRRRGAANKVRSITSTINYARQVQVESSNQQDACPCKGSLWK